MTSTRSLPSWDGGDSTVARDLEISYCFRDEEDQQENESVPKGCTIIIERNKAYRGMQPCNQIQDNTVMRKSSLVVTQDSARNTEGL